VLFDQPNAEYVRKNLLLDHYFGVDVKFSSSMVGVLASIGWNYVKARVAGRRPYFVTAGASSPLGNLGFVNAVYELKSQVDEGVVPEIDYIVVAAGSLGTSAGLDLGCRLLDMRTRVIGVAVAMPLLVNRFRMARMVRSINAYMRRYDRGVPKVDVDKEDLILPSDYLGKEYACFTEPGVKMVKDMRDLGGIPIEPTYTGKAFSGGLDWLEKRGEKEKTVLLWDTYNSVDLSHFAAQVDYRDLPRAFHKYFEEPTQEETFNKKEG
jgi:D-cysteine desulfhydrase